MPGTVLPKPVHVIGAGLAGLACATALAAAGRPVAVYEATGQAGGRCRSFLDTRLGTVIDNGNHLVLGGNAETFRYLDRLGARDRMLTVAPAAIPFMDLSDGTRWTIRPGRGPLPFWLLDPARRIPGAGAIDHLGMLRLAWAAAGATVAETLDLGTVAGRRLWRPLAVSILNTQPEEASARLLWTVFSRTLLKGEAACRPCIPRRSLSDALIDPALSFLGARGCQTRTKVRLKGLVVDGARVTALVFDDGELALADGEQVVLALPPTTAAQLLPGLSPPDAFRPILNAHFRVAGPARLPDGAPLLGLVGGTAEWLFARDDLLSVTVSAAEGLIDRDEDELAGELWADVATALRLSGPMPTARIIKEKRATFAATPAMLARRPPGRTRIANLFLAGDWTDTGLPATIEGAIGSGHTAAALAGL